MSSKESDILPLESMREAQVILDGTEQGRNVDVLAGALCVLLSGFLDVAIEQTEEE